MSQDERNAYIVEMRTKALREEPMRTIYRQMVRRAVFHPDEHLRAKFVNILVTNACNLTCGGCLSLCGHYTKPQIWHISLDEFHEAIQVIGRWMYNPNNNIGPDFDFEFLDTEPQGVIGIFGGEPTVHPQWDQLVEIMYSYPQYNFWVRSNGRIPVEDNKNIYYRVRTKDKLDGVEWYPTLVNPKDVLGVEEDEFYWDKARKQCCEWMYCPATIYNNKAYFCNVAAAMDHVMDLGIGWPVTEDSNPFDKTPEEIAEQAKQACSRCGYCLSVAEKDRFGVPKQRVNEPTLITIGNLQSIAKPNMRNLNIVDIPKQKGDDDGSSDCRTCQ